jgi:hypothetical protein
MGLIWPKCPYIVALRGFFAQILFDFDQANGYVALHGQSHGIWLSTAEKSPSMPVFDRQQ